MSSQREIIVAVVCGTLFGAGLVISGMTDRFLVLRTEQLRSKRVPLEIFLVTTVFMRESDGRNPSYGR